MPDKDHPTLIQFQRLHAWNQNALIYTNGKLEQQSLKIFRYLGTLAEGVQKMQGLDVASGAGNLLANLFTCCAFTGISPEEFEFQLRRDTDADFIAKQSPAMQVQLLVAWTVTALSDLNHWDSVAGTRLSRAVALESVGKSLEALKAVANKGGFYLDRCLVNAVTVIIKKDGQLDEFGQFRPRPDQQMMFIDPNGNPPVVTKPSGQAVAQYITISLRSRFDVLHQKMTGEIIGRHLIDEVDREINQHLDELLDKFIRSDDKWRKMLFERNPHFTVVVEQGELNVNANEDLAWLFDELRKDQKKI